MDDFDAFFGRAAVVQTRTKQVIEEPLQLDAIGLKENPLLWWKEHESRLPRLATLARTYLAIQASSAPVERVFSASGWIVSKRRCSMTDRTVMLLTFLSVNQHHLTLTV